jgi:outer membrane receptor for monomeric catechols
MATSKTFWLANVAHEDEAQSTGLAFQVNPDGKTVDIWATFCGYDEMERETCKRVSIQEAREIYRERISQECSHYGQLWVPRDTAVGGVPRHPGHRYAVMRGVPVEEADEHYYGAA